MKLAILFFVLAAGAWAKSERFELKGKKFVTVNYPEGWETAKELYGIPLAVLGPWKNESRPVLSILPTGLTTKMFDQKQFPELFKDFKLEKEDWLKDHKGELLKYEPVVKVDLRNDLTGHYIGAEFKINGIHFIERSYYLYCKDEVYNLKYSIRDEHRKYLNDLQEMVKGFRCE